MCKRLPIVTLLTIAGVVTPGLTARGQQPPAAISPPSVQPGTPPATTPSPGPEPKVLLEQAIRALERRSCISAQVRLKRVDLFGKQLVGSGRYLEQRSNGVVRFKLESAVPLQDQLSNLTLLCDGKYLWKYLWLRDRGTLTRIDVERVLRTLEETGEMDRLGRAGAWPGIGGLARLLRGLYANFEFQTIEPTQLAGVVIENASVATQLPAWKLRGQWNRQRLAQMLPELKEQILAGQPVELARLPEPLPHEVELYLGSEDLFLYRLDYFRQRSKDKEGQGRLERQPVASVELRRPIVTLELFGVNWNPIDPATFNYNPGNLDVQDQTNEFLRSLELGK